MATFMRESAEKMLSVPFMFTCRNRYANPNLHIEIIYGEPTEPPAHTCIVVPRSNAKAAIVRALYNGFKEQLHLTADQAANCEDYYKEYKPKETPVLTPDIIKQLIEASAQANATAISAALSPLVEAVMAIKNSKEECAAPYTPARPNNILARFV
jgi:hypothetical protein